MKTRARHWQKKYPRTAGVSAPLFHATSNKKREYSLAKHTSTPIKPHDSALGQPLRMAANGSDWGDSLNQHHRVGKWLTMVMMFVGGGLCWCSTEWYGARLGGSLCHTHNLTLRLFSRTCLHTTSDDDQTRPHKKHKQHDKQHHHGVGAARPSSGMNLMNPCLPRGGRLSTYLFQCRCRSDLIDSIN